MNRQLYLYDIEVFKEDWIIVFKRADKDEYKVYHNEAEDMEEFLQDKILVGFNNYNYDDYILSAILENYTNKEVKWLNDAIINNELQVKYKYLNKDLVTFDTMQEINGNLSLKEYMANAGLNIEETPISFDIDRKLSEEELKEVIKYCKNDVDATENLLRERYSYFKNKIELINMSDKKTQRWNTTTISAFYLTDNIETKKWNDIRVEEEILEKVDERVKKHWLDNRFEYTESSIESYILQDENLELTFGAGGLHADVEKCRVENVILLDVNSLYPNLIVNNRILEDKTEKYKEILEERLKAKEEGNKRKSDTLKLILNTCYGNLNNKYSKLYNPFSALSICIIGQIALYDLFCKIKQYTKIIQINTDGIAFTEKNKKWKEEVEKWEKEWNLKLSKEDFKVWIQKDVNNYVAIKKNNEIIVKGTDVKSFYKDNLGKTKARITDLAIVNKLLFNKDIEETVIENLENVELFQIVLKNSNKYKATVDEDRNIYNKVNRVFASKNSRLCLYRLQKNDNFARFPDSPTKMFIFNKNLKDIDLDKFKNEIDIEYYVNLAEKKIKKWG